MSKTAFVEETPEATALENLVIGNWYWSTNNAASMTSILVFDWNNSVRSCTFHEVSDNLSGSPGSTHSSNPSTCSWEID